MLYIDNKNFLITKKNIYIGNFTKDFEKGYNICIQLEFTNNDNNEKGYINLEAGFEKKDNINLFLNREYSGVPFDSNDNQYIFFEIFDTKKFLDTEIESTIKIKIKDIKNDQVEVLFQLNDELIKLNFYGYCDIDYKNIKETFSC